jgi:S1-C subfamily serine protease
MMHRLRVGSGLASIAVLIRGAGHRFSLDGMKRFSRKQGNLWPVLATLMGGIGVAVISKENSTICEGKPEFLDKLKSHQFLTRNFIADAAAVILPSVVNIVSQQGGFLPMASAGSGFIISKVG